MTTINFTPPPTCARFMKSEAFTRIIAGPVGSGKTTTCIFELLRRAIEQAPCNDGLRHTRFAIVRQTLKQLKDTVLKDIEQWLKGIVSYKVSENTVYVSFGDVRSEWLLIPLEDPEDQRRLLSMQLTGSWASEIIEMSPDIVPPLSGRCGRFPGKGMMPADHKGKWPTWYGIIADTNMPTEGDAWHKLMELETPPNWQIFKQPGGLTPEAENIDNLPEGRVYYERQAQGHSPDWIKRYINAEYGNDPSGSAVFKETFKRSFHVINEELTPVFGYPLIVAQDFGRNPCALICQMDHKGRALVLEEIIAEDMGLERHLQAGLLPALTKDRYVGRQVIVIGDPAGRQRSTSYEETSFDLIKRSGLMAYPAPTNDIAKRLRAVDALLLQQRDGGPALMIDGKSCPMLVLALQGRYRYTRRKTGQLSPTPEKSHPYSDLADDLQYFCLVVQGGMHQYLTNRVERLRTVNNQPPKRFTSAAWT